MLKAKNIHKVYRHPASADRDVHVLKGVSVDVDQGDVLGIVGPSGAGKSTLLHVMGGLDQPTQGDVFFGDQDIYKLNDKKRAQMRNEHIGFIFQFYHLLPEFSALENVMLPALVKYDTRLTAEMKARGFDLLKRVGMAERASHKPNELSGGEQQRIAIARALVNQPDILFCDEPTGNLDSANGDEVMNLLMQLNRDNGQAVVMVTHDEKIAERCGRVIYLKDGSVVNSNIETRNTK